MYLALVFVNSVPFPWRCVEVPEGLHCISEKLILGHGTTQASAENPRLCLQRLCQAQEHCYVENHAIPGAPSRSLSPCRSPLLLAFTIVPCLSCWHSVEAAYRSHTPFFLMFSDFLNLYPNLQSFFFLNAWKFGA